MELPVQATEFVPINPYDLALTVFSVEVIWSVSFFFSGVSKSLIVRENQRVVRYVAVSIAVAWEGERNVVGALSWRY